jgi:ribosome-binding factor A
MSQRISRVNELLQREVSMQLHQNYRNSAATITISGVETASDLRRASVFYCVLGGDKEIAEAKKLFKRVASDLQRRVSKFVILKYFPKFEFIYDPSLKRGATLIDKLNDLD